MTMTPAIATMRITSSIREAELALDEALCKLSRLLTQLITARIEDEGDAFVGQAEVMRLINAQKSISASANDLARVHGGMLDIGRERLLIDDCPDENGPVRRGFLAV